MSNHHAASILSITAISAIFNNEVIRVIKSIFLNIKQVSSSLRLISTSSSSSSILLFHDPIFISFGSFYINEVIKVIKLIFLKMIPFDSIFDADVSGITFTF